MLNVQVGDCSARASIGNGNTIKRDWKAVILEGVENTKYKQNILFNSVQMLWIVSSDYPLRKKKGSISMIQFG